VEIIRGKTSGNLNTELYDVLFDLPKHILFNYEHELREPLGIYNVSIGRVWRAFDGILKIMYGTVMNFQEADMAHKELLDSIMAFIDDTYQIFKCFYSKDIIKKNINFADQWLEKVDKPLVDDYKEAIKPYRNRIALIVNKTKHNHARYCHVIVSYSYRKIAGYYIEGVNHEGQIIPNLEIHPRFNGMYTATSYNKDIRTQLFNCYSIAQQAARVVRQILISKGILPSPNADQNDDEQLAGILNGVTSLSELYFPDESDDDLPQISFNGKTVVFRKPPYKTYLDRIFRPNNISIHAIMSGDGVTKSWALPYL